MLHALTRYMLKQTLFVSIFVVGLFPDMLVPKMSNCSVSFPGFPAFNMLRSHPIHFNCDACVVKAPGRSYFHNST